MADIQQTVEVVANKANIIATSTGGGVAVYGAFTLQGWAIVGGLTISLFSAIVSLVYKHKHFKLEELKAKQKN